MPNPDCRPTWYAAHMTVTLREAGYRITRATPGNTDRAARRGCRSGAFLNHRRIAAWRGASAR